MPEVRIPNVGGCMESSVKAQGQAWMRGSTMRLSTLIDQNRAGEVSVPKSVFAGFLLFLTLGAAGVLMKAQSEAGARTIITGVAMSEREQNRLRGPVKSCVQESTYPAFTDSSGKAYPERKWKQETEYDREGHVITRRSWNSGGPESLTRYTYDNSGRLRKVTSNAEGAPPAETVYSYDEHGGLDKISDSRKPASPVTYRYDEHGRKTEVAVVGPEEYRPNVALGGSPFQVAGAAYSLQGGGTVTTIYDDQDRPVEVQVRDHQGEVVIRAVRTYDAQGHVIEEKQVLDSPEMMIPAEVRNQILKESGLPAEQLREELRAKLTSLMGGQAGPSAESYTYDAQGRVSSTRRRIFNQQEVIETTYNEHGDKAVEIATAKALPADGASNPEAALIPYSEAHYSYVYDSFGNWTEQSIYHRSSPDGNLATSSVLKRTLSYY
jgi:hypothetical protein